MEKRRTRIDAQPSRFGKALYSLLYKIVDEVEIGDVPLEPPADLMKRPRVKYIPNSSLSPKSSRWLKEKLNVTDSEPEPETTTDGTEAVEMIEFSNFSHDGNLIIKNEDGVVFTLAEGEEYEIIGEAVSDHGHDNIEIIEVDHETMASLTAGSTQGRSDVSSQTIVFNDSHHGTSDTIQITELSDNDENIGQIVKLIGSEEAAFYHQQE